MKNIKKSFLLLNGEKPKKLPNLSDYELICATDGAYNFLKTKKIIPHLITGDFDSITHIPKNIEVICTPNQNFTDFEKALQILHKKGHTTVDVFGASGKEQDHFLGNLHTAIQWENKLKLTFFDNYGRYFLFSKNTILQKVKNKTISLVPFPSATQVTTKGLEYQLNKEDLVFGKRIGIRNKAIKNEIEVTFKTGKLFIFVNH